MAKGHPIFAVILLFGAGIFPAHSQQITLAVSDLVPQGLKESEAAIVSEQLRAASKITFNY